MMMVILDNGAAFDNLDSALGASRVETRSTLQPTLTHLRWCTVNIIIADVTIFIDNCSNHDDQPTYGDGHSSHSLPFSFQGAAAPYGDSTVYQEVLPSQVSEEGFSISLWESLGYSTLSTGFHSMFKKHRNLNYFVQFVLLTF